MERKSKLLRKNSLSLGSNNKRHSASPQNRLRAAQVASATKTKQHSPAPPPPPRSPSSISSDYGIDCTPPNNRKRSSMIMNNNNNNNLDDSIDYSPKPFDMSFSPGSMLSQTLVTDSPEVGWRWTRRHAEDTAAVTTPDSAYAADSSFSSISNSAGAGRTRGDTLRQRVAYEQRHDEKCKVLELKRQRAEKLRADEMLKQRCAKLQEQLKDAAKVSSSASGIQQVAQVDKQKQPLEVKLPNPKATAVNLPTPTRKNTRFSLGNKLPPTLASAAVSDMVIDISASPSNSDAKETFNDFFNDSDSDCFLLEATQQLESKISTTLSQQKEPPAPTLAKKLAATVSHSAPAPAPPAAIATTPTSSSCKDKRSSFYLQFLEDDSDDWFVSLDDVAILQATEAKKPRSSFQRYKSMPANSTTTSAIADSEGESGTHLTTTATTKTTATTFGCDAVSGAAVSKIKRHASSHALSPSSSSSGDSFNSYLNLGNEILQKILQTKNENSTKPRSIYGFRRQEHAFRGDDENMLDYDVEDDDLNDN